MARHPDLIGDSVLGQDEFLRFLPTRFNPKGEAYDGGGMPAGQMACPRCHLHISEALLEVPPLFVSMIGSPASGKSYFLTTMTWELRRLLPRAALSFTDADPEANGPITEYEQTLFMNEHAERPVAIRKTQTDDPRLHKVARINGMDLRLSLPLQFTVWPTATHPYFQAAHRVGRVLVFYDNAGEDCLPGTEAASSMVVQHLARSGILFMLFDPAQDPDFRKRCTLDDPQLTQGLRPGAQNGGTLMRQEMILKEAAVRVRRFLGLSQSERLKKPLIIIVAKFDMLGDVAGVSIDEEPYNGKAGGAPLHLDVDRVERTSDALRRLFMDVSPGLVATAEGLSEIVRFIPISSLGCGPQSVNTETQTFYGIRPCDIRPKWVTVPMIYCMTRYADEVLKSSR